MKKTKTSSIRMMSLFDGFVGSKMEPRLSRIRPVWQKAGALSGCEGSVSVLRGCLRWQCIWLGVLFITQMGGQVGAEKHCFPLCVTENYRPLLTRHLPSSFL